MSHLNPIQCTDWNGFKTVVSGTLFPNSPFQRGVYIFRGHGSPKWPLMSSFDRWYHGAKKKKMKAADRLLALFRNEVENRAVDVPKDIWSDGTARLALAQHNGIPTRLLDWTESPYIAAFFAFAGIALTPHHEPNVAIWVLDTRHEIWSREFGVELLEVPPHGNDRLRTQLGRFTLLRAPFDTLEEYVSQFEDNSEALRLYLVPSDDAQVALADLDLMGINYSLIFPGLEGCARAARLRILFDDVVDFRKAP